MYREKNSVATLYDDSFGFLTSHLQHPEFQLGASAPKEAVLHDPSTVVANERCTPL